MEVTLREAVEVYGEDMQITVAIEELSELIKELCKYKRGIGSEIHIAEEMADVKIILEELEIIFDNKRRVDIWYKDKVERLKWKVGKDYIEIGRGYKEWKRSFENGSNEETRA